MNISFCYFSASLELNFKLEKCPRNKTLPNMNSATNRPSSLEPLFGNCYLSHDFLVFSSNHARFDYSIPHEKLYKLIANFYIKIFRSINLIYLKLRFDFRSTGRASGNSFGSGPVSGGGGESSLWT